MIEKSYTEEEITEIVRKHGLPHYPKLALYREKLSRSHVTTPVSHGKPYAGKLHVRFDEGYPPKNGEARFEGSRRPSGRTLRGRLALLY